MDSNGAHIKLLLLKCILPQILLSTDDVAMHRSFTLSRLIHEIEVKGHQSSMRNDGECGNNSGNGQQHFIGNFQFCLFQVPGNTATTTTSYLFVNWTKPFAMWLMKKNTNLTNWMAVALSLPHNSHLPLLRFDCSRIFDWKKLSLVILLMSPLHPTWLKSQLDIFWSLLKRGGILSRLINVIFNGTAIYRISKVRLTVSGQMIARLKLHYTDCTCPISNSSIPINSMNVTVGNYIVLLLLKKVTYVPAVWHSGTSIMTPITPLPWQLPCFSRFCWWWNDHNHRCNRNGGGDSWWRLRK